MPATSAMPIPADKLKPEWQTKACLALSLCGALSALFVNHCSICTKAMGLLNGVSLSYVGILFYSMLLALSHLRATRLVTWCCVAAAGVHLALLALLFAYRIACVPCLLTAAGAFFATTDLIPRTFRKSRTAAAGPGGAGVRLQRRGILCLGSCQRASRGCALESEHRRRHEQRRTRRARNSRPAACASRPGRGDLLLPAELLLPH